MAANLSGVLRSTVVVHAHASKHIEPGPSFAFVFEPLHNVFEIFVARRTAWNCRPISSLKAAALLEHECRYLSGHIRGAQSKQNRQYLAVQRAASHRKTRSAM